MLVKDFTDLVLDAHISEIKVYDNEQQTDIYKGCVYDLQDDILYRSIGSWNIEDNTLCLNID